MVIGAAIIAPVIITARIASTITAVIAMVLRQGSGGGGQSGGERRCGYQDFQVHGRPPYNHDDDMVTDCGSVIAQSGSIQGKKQQKQ
jgi:hypothetical protein